PYVAHMNCVGVTCLSVVELPRKLASRPPYLAETSFQVPTSLFSGFAPPFGSSAPTGTVVTASAMAAARHRVAIVVINSPSTEGFDSSPIASQDGYPPSGRNRATERDRASAAGSKPARQVTAPRPGDPPRPPPAARCTAGRSSRSRRPVRSDRGPG